MLSSVGQILRRFVGTWCPIHKKGEGYWGRTFLRDDNEFLSDYLSSNLICIYVCPILRFWIRVKAKRHLCCNITHRKETFLTSAEDRGKWPVRRPGCYTPWKENPDTLFCNIQRGDDNSIIASDTSHSPISQS